MRLPDIARGDSRYSRALIRLISAVSDIRLTDAARVAYTQGIRRADTRRMDPSGDARPQ